MKPDDRIRIRHIADALMSVARFIQGRTQDDLGTDEMLLFALVRAIEIVGEAANKVSAETRERYPQIPWVAIIGMRHRLAHAYFDINHDILWTTVTEAAPTLLAHIQKLLESD